MHTTTSNLMKSILVLTLAFLGSWTDLRADTRPNIVWIIPDDMSANFSCYGETAIQTPHVDALARRGMKFTRAFVTAPVCSTCRSAFITGMYQTSIGAHHHRSGRGDQARVVEPVRRGRLGSPRARARSQHPAPRPTVCRVVWRQ